MTTRHSRSENMRRKMSESQRARYAKTPPPPAHRAKLSQSLKRAYAEGRRVCAASLLAGEEHIRSKEWVIVSPEGVRYSLINLSEWCRANTHLLPLDAEKYKRPLWLRAASALAKQGVWRDWRLAASQEAHGSA